MTYYILHAHVHRLTRRLKILLLFLFRYTELPGTSYSPQRGTGPGYHLRQCAPREPYNPLAPIREQPPMYKLTFEVTERSHDPGMPFRGPPPLPPRPLNNPQHRPSKQYYI